MTRKLVLTAVFAAVPVVLSFVPGSIPVAGAKLLPWQHMTNAVAGVVLGPWYAALAATLAAVLRNLFGVGTLLAFPGGIPGALVVGLADGTPDGAGTSGHQGHLAAEVDVLHRLRSSPPSSPVHPFPRWRG